MTPAARQLAADNADVARAIVGSYVRRTPGAAHLADDLLGAAYEGLLTAAERFDPRRGIKFSTFAGRRIFGSMIEVMRNERAGSKRGGAPAALALELRHERADRRTPEVIAIARGDLRRLDAMPRKRRSVLRGVAMGDQLTTAARRVGITKGWACRIRQQAARDLAA